MSITHQQKIEVSQAGAGMIEMMVALFILAVGLLGVLAMQMSGIDSAQRANFSTEAHIVAADMVDRILAADDIDTLEDNDAYDGVDTENANASAAGCIATGCAKSNDPGGAQMLYDEWEWSTTIARLPSGRGTVAYDGANGVYTVRVFWDGEREGTATGLGCTNDPDDLACYSIEVKM